VSDMNDRIRAARGRSQPEVVEDDATPNEPTFGGRLDPTGPPPPNANTKLRRLFDNRPRARGAYRIGRAS
jgi:hypothetical protein